MGTGGDMGNWNFDIDAAPKGDLVQREVTTKRGTSVVEVFQPVKLLLATECGKVTASRYLPEAQRWEALAKGEAPLAWQLWPEHPNAAPVTAGGTPLEHRGDIS